jgi:hypothetical protein
MDFENDAGGCYGALEAGSNFKRGQSQHRGVCEHGLRPELVWFNRRRTQIDADLLSGRPARTKKYTSLRDKKYFGLSLSRREYNLKAKSPLYFFARRACSFIGQVGIGKCNVCQCLRGSAVNLKLCI